MTGNTAHYDLIIIGGGIAGLAAAEIFARSGQRVLLVEKQAKLCTGASGCHHEWFHFGSLYSIFPHNQFLRTMVGGIDDLLEFYAHFDGMNLAVDSKGRLITIDGPEPWFRDEMVEYIISATNDPDFLVRRAGSLRQALERVWYGLTWDFALKQFISRHNRFYNFDWRTGPASHHIPRGGWWDYSKNIIEKYVDDDINLDPDTHFKITGYDRPMQALHIIKDLVRSLGSNRGEILLHTSYEGYEKKDEEILVHLGDKGTRRASKLVVASGKALVDHLPSIRFKNVASPLLIAYPHVAEINMVRLTPFMSETINHMKHFANGKAYSLIGGGYYADPCDDAGIERAKKSLLEKARAIFPRLGEAEFIEVYASQKTEMIGSPGERNYQYHIKKADDNVYAVIPGKFSLAFSLAVNLHKQLAGTPPRHTGQYEKDIDIGQFIAPMYHKKRVMDYLGGSKV